jgi:hypothetical protein
LFSIVGALGIARVDRSRGVPLKEKRGFHNPPVTPSPESGIAGVPLRESKTFCEAVYRFFAINGM